MQGTLRPAHGEPHRADHQRQREAGRELGLDRHAELAQGLEAVTEHAEQVIRDRDDRVTRVRSKESVRERRSMSSCWRRRTDSQNSIAGTSLRSMNSPRVGTPSMRSSRSSCRRARMMLK
jgi:hypothetical protein